MVDLRKREGVAARAFEFAILTAARTNEALGATWSEIDLDAAVWTIPADRMKARKDHRVPLSETAVELLRSMPRDKGSDFVFISPMARGKPLSNMALLATLKRMERSDLTAHGFRSTFRDWAAETTGYPDAVVEMALAHAIGNAVEAAYRRGDLFEKRKRLMADWAAYCSIRGPADQSVVPIRKAQKSNELSRDGCIFSLFLLWPICASRRVALLLLTPSWRTAANAERRYEHQVCPIARRTAESSRFVTQCH
jgi:hypothetical protein